jgi:hypothetical protein
MSLLLGVKRTSQIVRTRLATSVLFVAVYALGLTILNFSLSALLGGNWIPVLLEACPMHKIYKVKINKKYPFKEMKVFKLHDDDVRGAQVMASYYRNQCKRPIIILITKRDDGYHCRRVG